MATPSVRLIDSLRKAAANLSNGLPYQWGHMGSCNCGHLAQVLTPYAPAEIHAYALRSRQGDWADQVSAFCPTSGLPMDMVIEAMLDEGLTRKDLRNLEKLSDKHILSRFPFANRHLKHNQREDVIAYLSMWAEMLEEQLVTEMEVPVFVEIVRL